MVGVFASNQTKIRVNNGIAEQCHLLDQLGNSVAKAPRLAIRLRIILIRLRRGTFRAAHGMDISNVWLPNV